MTDIRQIREKLGDKMKATKKKKKGKKKGGLRSQMTMGGRNTTGTDANTEIDDGVTSYYTRISADDDFAGILVDYCFTNFQ